MPLASPPLRSLGDDEPEPDYEALDLIADNVANDLATHAGFNTPAFRSRFEAYAKTEIRKAIYRALTAVHSTGAKT